MNAIFLAVNGCAHCGVAIACLYPCKHEAHFCEEREECEQRAVEPRADHNKEAV